MLPIENLPVDRNPVSVQVPGMPVAAEQSEVLVVGIVDEPRYQPFAFIDDGVIELKEMVPTSIALPVTRFSTSFDVMLKTPDAWVLPRVPNMAPPTLVPAQTTLPLV